MIDWSTDWLTWWFLGHAIRMKTTTGEYISRRKDPKRKNTWDRVTKFCNTDKFQEIRHSDQDGGKRKWDRAVQTTKDHSTHQFRPYCITRTKHKKKKWKQQKCWHNLEGKKSWKYSNPWEYNHLWSDEKTITNTTRRANTQMINIHPTYRTSLKLFLWQTFGTLHARALNTNN